MAFSGMRSFWSWVTGSGGTRRIPVRPDGEHSFLPQDSVITSGRTRCANKLGEGSFAKVCRGEYNSQPCRDLRSSNALLRILGDQMVEKTLKPQGELAENQRASEADRNELVQRLLAEKERDEQAETVRKEAEEKEKQLKTLKKELSEKQQCLDEQQREIAALTEDKVGELKDKVKDLEQKVANLFMDNVALKTKLEAIRKVERQQQDEITRLKERLVQALTAQDTATQEQSLSRTRESQLEEEVKVLEETRSDLEAEVEKLKKQMKQLEILPSDVEQLAKPHMVMLSLPTNPSIGALLLSKQSELTTPVQQEERTYELVDPTSGGGRGGGGQGGGLGGGQGGRQGGQGGQRRGRGGGRGRGRGGRGRGRGRGRRGRGCGGRGGQGRGGRGRGRGRGRGEADSPQIDDNIWSENVSEHPRCLMLFRIHISRRAAGKGRAVLEGVGFDAPTIAACFSARHLDEEGAVQEGLIKWCGGAGFQPPTWRVLVKAIEYANIAQQDIGALRRALSSSCL